MSILSSWKSSVVRTSIFGRPLFIASSGQGVRGEMYEIMEICMALFKGGQSEWGLLRNHVAVRMPSCLGFHRGWLVSSFGD
jgi:hypothetical protein